MTGGGGRVALKDALDPLVVALDVGSTASRGDVYDAAGRPVEGGRRKVAHQFRSGADGASELDEAQVQQRTGCRLHSSYLPARLRWLRDSDPDRLLAARRWLSLGEYVYLRLLGTTAAGTATAAWTGLLDRRTGRWDAEMLRAAGVEAGQLSEVRDPDRPLTEVDPGVEKRWPVLAGARW